MFYLICWKLKKIYFSDTWSVHLMVVVVFQLLLITPYLLITMVYGLLPPTVEREMIGLCKHRMAVLRRDLHEYVLDMQVN